MGHKKKQTIPWFIKIADAITEGKTFTLEDDGGPWPTVHHSIAHFMLREMTAYEKACLFHDTARKVRTNLPAAIAYLLRKNIPVYRQIPKNKKHIFVLSIEPHYKGDDLERITEKMISHMRAGITEVKLKHQDELEQAQVRLIGFVSDVRQGQVIQSGEESELLGPCRVPKSL